MSCSITIISYPQCIKLKVVNCMTKYVSVYGATMVGNIIFTMYN